MSERTSKSIAERIDINYWKELHPLRRWKWLLAAACGVVASLWLAWNAVRGDARIYQAGPVSTAHAFLERNCGACHTESWQPALRLVTANPMARSTPDAACTRCHDGPIHHEQQVAEAVPHCASCHREHRGAAALAHVPDSLCTTCHGDLKTSSQPLRFEAHVTSFATGHPEFGVIRRHEPDATVIKLNHAVHMKPDGVLTAQGSLEVLQCSSCHQPDRDSDRNRTQPIRHEAHCSRCHSNALQFDTQRFADRPAPHRDPDTVRAMLRDLYTRLVREHPESVEGSPASPGERRLPGRDDRSVRTRAEWDWVHDRVTAAERVLFEGAGGCRYCHQVSRDETGWQVTNPRIPSRWMQHAQFRHDSHRMLSCASCHAASSSTRTEDVLLPSIETCRSCHQPDRGARSDCTACHTYHDRSHERGFDGPFGVHDFRF
jgi:hypothetical protein